LEKRRVVVTGVGLVTALGTGTEETWKGLCDGRSGVGPISRFDSTEFSTKIAAEVKDFDPLKWFDKKDLKKMDFFIYYAVAAADFAMKQSGLVIDQALSERVGVFIGSGIGGFTVIEREHKALLEGGPRKISPFFIPSSTGMERSASPDTAHVPSILLLSFARGPINAIVPDFFNGNNWLLFFNKTNECSANSRAALRLSADNTSFAARSALQ
jgi:3-oxoacyl-(acyl-carrier-protein) synthase